jgi:hypothetical protein
VVCIPDFRIIGIAKPGDESWMVVKYTSSENEPTMMFLGNFYHISESNLMVLKTSADRPPQPPEIVAKLHNKVNILSDSVHLVDNDGELMLVHRTRPGDSRRRYDVYRLDLDKRALFTVDSFDGRAMFMGNGFSFFVSQQVSRCIISDTIYLSFDLHERTYNDIEAYHLPDRSIKTANYILDQSVSRKKKYMPWPHTIVDCLSLCDTSRLYSETLCFDGIF